MIAIELRLGNYIFEQDCHPFYFPVEQITKAANGHRIHYRYNSISCMVEDAQPIKLTEEWLLKFDFKKARTFDELNRWFIGVNPVTKDWLFDLVWLDGAKSPFYRNGHHQIQYVHQLQNLFFALAGTELELKK